MSQVEAANTGAIVSKLGSIGMVLIALHKLAISHGNGVDGDTLATAVESMTKQAFRSLDACIVQLGDIPMGNFSEEFEQV